MYCSYQLKLIAAVSGISETLLKNTLRQSVTFFRLLLCMAGKKDV